MIDDSLGLSFIAGKLTFDTQIYWGMSVVIKDDDSTDTELPIWSLCYH